MWWQELTIIAGPAFSSGQLCEPCNDLQLLEGYLMTSHESRNEHESRNGSDPRQFGPKEKYGPSMCANAITRQYYEHNLYSYSFIYVSI